MKRFVINTVFLLIVLSLVAGTVVGKRGFMHLMKLDEEYRHIALSNQRLKQENERLKAEIEDLKNNLRYLEELARNELGLAKQGEIIYRSEKKN